MSGPDLNLLIALEALLSEGSVAGAAQRLGLSASAMSRTLSRLRLATGDPLLVRAGRTLTPTPRAIELRDSVRELTQQATAALMPAKRSLDLASLARVFTLRANDSFIEMFAADLILAATAAPGVQLRFAPKPDKDVRALREGAVDLDIGVLTETGPEVRIQTLMRDHFVAAVRNDHPLLEGEITAQRYAAADHVVASRRGRTTGPVDAGLAALGLARATIVVVPSFSAALAVAVASDRIVLAPASYIASGPYRTSLVAFLLPVATPEIVVSQMWHPKNDGDLAHRWLRSLVWDVTAPARQVG